jgi:hypothetical protein
MKILFALIFLFIAFMCFMIYLVGSHGHLMFRPYMIEDWLIWAMAFISFIAGPLFLIKAFRRK